MNNTDDWKLVVASWISIDVLALVIRRVVERRYQSMPERMFTATKALQSGEMDVAPLKVDQKLEDN